MIQKVKQLVNGKECQSCGGPIEGSYVLEDVKVPGYTGRHEKPFCSEECLEKWQAQVEEWEEDNYRIPMSNTGTACGGC